MELPNMQKPTRMNPQRFCFRLFFSALLLALCAGAEPCATAQTQARHEGVEQSVSGAFGHQAWTNENGLPQNSVHQILQTRDGYLWVATEGGAARFNGTQFTTYNQESNAAFTSNDACC